MHEQSFSFIRLINKNRLSELYFAVVLKSLALSMIGIFIPVYLYNDLGLSLSQVISFYLIWSVLFAVLTPFMAKLAARFGLKHMIVASVPFEIIFMVLLVLMKTHHLHYAFSAIVYTIAGTFFWTGFNIEFSKVSRRKKRGSEIGFLYFLATLSGIIGPFFGGMILTFMGFNVLFYVFTTLLIIGIVPLLLTSDDHERIHLSFSHMFKKKYTKDMLAFTGWGARFISATVFWPLFIFVALQRYLDLGILATGAGLVTALSSFYVGKLSDKFNKKKLLDVGAIVHSLTWAVRWFASSFLQLFTVAIFSGISFVFMNIPFNSIFFNKMSKRDKVEYIVFREIGFSTGKALILVVVLLTQSFVVGFLVAGLATLAYMTYQEK